MSNLATSPPLSRRLLRRLATVVSGRVVDMVNAAPIVSVSFDDCPRSAVTIGAEILERHHARGSFYVCGGLAGRDWENGLQFDVADLQRLRAAGHEIGCHTFSHPDCAAMTAQGLEREFNQNQEFLSRNLQGFEADTFAYPYGSVSLTAKRMARERFRACRGVGAGVNAGAVDLALLKSVALPSTAVGPDWIAPWIEQVVATRGWLVLFTHDVSSSPTPYGCRPEVLDAALTALKRAGVEIRTIANAARVVTGQHCATL